MTMGDDRVALVTGAASGIGRATALAFAAQGTRVVVADVAREAGEQTVALLRARGGDGLFVQADVSQAVQVEALVERALAVYGQLDVAFNNAGIQGGGTATADCSEEFWDRVVSVNLKGVFLC